MENEVLWQDKGVLGTEREIVLPGSDRNISITHFGLVDKNTEPYECLLLDVQLKTQKTNFKAFFHSQSYEYLTEARFPACVKVHGTSLSSHLVS